MSPGLIAGLWRCLALDSYKDTMGRIIYGLDVSG